MTSSEKLISTSPISRLTQLDSGGWSMVMTFLLRQLKSDFRLFKHLIVVKKLAKKLAGIKSFEI
jgi:hypothetical protein